MPIKLKVSVFFAALFLQSALFSGDMPIYYTSDSSTISFTDTGEPGEITLHGGVKIIFGDTTMLCEKAGFNRVTGEITAIGPITVESPEGIFKAEQLLYYTGEEKGVLSDPSFSMPPLHGRAEKVHREGKRVILDRGYITTCDREHPHFRISAERMEYVRDDYIRAERMRLTFGKKFNVFYFPRYTIDARTKEAPITLNQGYSSRIGETADIIFTHRLRKTNDTLLKERISIGTKGIGFGMETLSREIGFSGTAFAYRRWDKDWLEPGGLFEFARSYDSPMGPGRIIFDWRWMCDNEFFKDFFHEEFMAKSKTYNYFSYTHNFDAGFLNVGFRHSAGDSFLKVEKLPELRFYSPPFRIGNKQLYMENDLRLTNFHREGEDNIRIMDIVTLKGRKDTKYMTLVPYVSIGGISYHSREHEGRFNLLGESGAKVSATLKKSRGEYTEYFSPSVAFFYRRLDCEPGELEPFDMFERLNDGKFLNLRTDWAFTGSEGYLGRISMENIYSIDREEFEENSLGYELKITPQLRLEGENEWDVTNMKYTFGVNDLVYSTGKYGYSLGNRYDSESAVSGITGRFTHVVNENWRYAAGLQYDINKGNFTRKSIEIWRKLHCWELNLKVLADNEDFSFYVMAYPILF